MVQEEGVLPSWTSLWQNTTGDGVAASNALLWRERGQINKVFHDKQTFKRVTEGD